MANHKSAAKRARQTIVRTRRNKARKGRVRSAEKKLRIAITNKDAEGAKTLLPKYVSELARAVKTGIYHKNHLARKEARMTSAVQALVNQ